MTEEVEDYELNKKAVEDVCKEPANSLCADCGANGTRWATVNHGQFVCIRCSGIHRSLGVHISKVKSTNLDKWTSAEVSVMRMVGNKLGRQLFEARLPAREKPSENDGDVVVREFIVKKYDEKKYAAPDWVAALKKVFKSAGYKAGKKSLKDAEDKKAETAAPAAAAVVASASDKKDKKSKKDKSAKVVGLFGNVNVADDVHDSRLAAVLQAFGVSIVENNGAAVAAGEEQQQQQPQEENGAQEEAVVAEGEEAKQE
jgi:hypothetical protein